MKHFIKIVSPTILPVMLLFYSVTSTAGAKPLTLYQLDGFAEYIKCTDGCSASDITCLDACPKENSDRWDKDLDNIIDEEDADLAFMEFWDDREELYICYQKEVGNTEEKFPADECDNDCKVVPYYFCGAAECLDKRNEEACKDFDRDGLRQWEEVSIGTDDTYANSVCELGSTASGCGFSEQCLEVDVDQDGNPDEQGRCFPMDCGGKTCTAFHLETITANNNELIVHVHYDFSPVEATILDLYIDYDFNYLTLVDARPLKGLKDSGKNLYVTQELDGLLRLTALSSGADTVIPMGNPIAELVFERIATGQTEVAFSNVDFLQEMSIAPQQGEHWQSQLTNDALWGEAVHVPAADPSGPRLLLHYSFDTPKKPRVYEDVKSAEALCEQDKSCNNLDTSIPKEKEDRKRSIAQLRRLQRGAERVSETIDGVIGPGAYMDGRTDHLEFPVTFNDPAPDKDDGRMRYLSRDQSFSLSTWFYSEGDQSLSLDENGQVLFSRNTPEELTRFGVAVQPVGADEKEVRLIWFKDEIGNNNLLENVIAVIPARKWTHLGLIFKDTLPGVDDDNDEETDEDDEYDGVAFFVDGDLKLMDPYPGVDDDQDGDTDEDDERVLEYLPFGRNNKNDPVYGNTFEMMCPAPRNAGGLTLHKEGIDNGALGGVGSPETLFFSSAENNLYGIEQMDLSGYERTDVIRDINSTAEDADYNPTIDKLVYTSSKTGNYEIWIANGDGTEPKQITKGFGDTERKIFARRPKWAPDGSAIVFESNIYSIEYMDNWFRRVYHLYYIAYDPVAGEVIVPTEEGQTVTTLDYDNIVRNDRVGDFRITSGGGVHHYHAVWERGRDEGKDRGALWYNASDEYYEFKRVEYIVIPESVQAPPMTAVSLKSDCDDTPPDDMDQCIPSEQEYTMLDAYARNTFEEGEQSEMLFIKEWSSFERQNIPYEIDSINRSEDTVTAYVKYVPGPECTDTDKTGCIRTVSNLYLKYTYIPEPGETKYNTFIDASIEDTEATYRFQGTDKEIHLRDTYTSCDQYVKIRVSSEINNDPIEAGDIIAVVHFKLVDGTFDSSDFVLETRKIHQQLAIKDMISERVAEFVMADDLLEVVDQAAFSPDGHRVVLSGIQNARPVVLVSVKDPDPMSNDKERENMFNIYDETDNRFELNVDRATCRTPMVMFEKISTEPMRVEGLDWEPIDKYYPCNWAGGYEDKITHKMGHAFRGGLDELKLYSYAREHLAFVSDWERGKAWLEKTDRDDELERRDNSCLDDTDCPAYKICLGDPGSKECGILPCDPDDPDSCKDHGICTLMPVSLEAGENLDFDGGVSDSDTDADGSELRWICSRECSNDRQCFSEECLNGPCRFCDTQKENSSSDPTWSCLECIETTREIGGQTFPYMEGCPDRNSYYCENGSCKSECYSMENGESKFICDPAVEYCAQGKCRIFDWDWTDFAPATLSGLGETYYDLEKLDHTVALSQLYPVEILAWGVEDYLLPPEIVVEGRIGTEGKDPYAGEWFRIGSVIVYNKTLNEARNNPYNIYSEFPITDIRMRMVIPQYENVNMSATGRRDSIDTECRANQCATCTDWLDGDNDLGGVDVCRCWSSENACKHRAPGSRKTIGYRVGIPRHEARRACYEKTESASCGWKADDPSQKYLWGGQQVVLIDSVSVNGKPVFNTSMSNTICPYSESLEMSGGKQIADGTIKPTVEQHITSEIIAEVPRMMYYGDISDELSNQKTRFYPLAKAGNFVSQSVGGGQSEETPLGSVVPLLVMESEIPAMLNCNYFNESKPDEQAVLKLSVCSSPTECRVLYPTYNQSDGPVKEMPNGFCTVENSMRSNPCYEYTNGDVSMDVMTYIDGAKEPWHTLDFDLHRSFGYDQGSLGGAIPEDEPAGE